MKSDYGSIPEAYRALGEAAGFGKPNWYIAGAAHPPVITPGIAAFLIEVDGERGE